MTIVAIDPERRAVRDVVLEVLAGRCSSRTVHDVVDAGEGVNPALDTELAGLGWFGIDVPEVHDGGGGSLALVQQVAEGCGWAAATTRWTATTALAVGALLHAGSDAQRRAWLPGLAAGTLAGTAALPGLFDVLPTDVLPADGIAAVAVDGGWRLDGRAFHVLDASNADVVVVLARTADGTAILGVVEAGVPGLTAERQATVDRTRNLGRVVLDGVELSSTSVLAEGDEATRAVTAVADRAAVLLAADSLGVATRVLETTTDYLGQRHQFGRAIGSFQAVKHQAADMLVRTELSRVLVDDAVDALDEGRPDASLAVSMAKEHAGATAVWVAGRGVQLHGGIGYTWEHDMHIYLKRAALNEALLGDRRWHRERIAGRADVAGVAGVGA